ncbi:hypothetical protein B0H13DRAFT_2656013 [Mycena leptocephala]|nr:hypothetical protein B0H13DRAFT_2656013 [Mycena leptocephala]
MSRQAPKRSKLQSSVVLRTCCLALHFILVAIHLVLAGIWVPELTHRIVFSLDNQNTISFLLTAISTTLELLGDPGIPSADPVRTPEPEKGSNVVGDARQCCCVDGYRVSTFQPLAAEGGFSIDDQRIVHSVISWQHRCASHHHPALFSLETFNSTRPINVRTQSFLMYNDSDHSTEDIYNYALGSLYFLPSIIDADNLGVHEGTLYDVLDVNIGVGTATVDAIGFNITCGYLPATEVNVTYSAELGTWGNIKASQPGIISTVSVNSNSIILYSTIPVLDSMNNSGISINLTPPMNLAVSAIQIFQCSLSLVPQHAIVDVQSRKLVTVEPTFEKDVSAWLPYTEAKNTGAGNTLMDSWGYMYDDMPPSDFPLTMPTSSGPYVTVGDLYLIQALNLSPADPTDIPNSVTLHDLENALSKLVASMFWTLGHIPPTHGAITWEYRNRTMVSVVVPPSNSTFLLRGNATVTEMFTQVHVNLSIIAVAVGLAASIGLMVLALPFSLFPIHDDQHHITIDGTGLLHAIWLYRNHPELSTLLDQVEHPTDGDLREAGMPQQRSPLWPTMFTTRSRREHNKAQAREEQVLASGALDAGYPHHNTHPLELRDLTEGVTSGC